MKSARRKRAGAGAAGRPQREGIEHLRQLVEVEVHEEEPVAEGVLDRLEAPVADPALVDGRGDWIDRQSRRYRLLGGVSEFPRHIWGSSSDTSGIRRSRAVSAPISAQARMALTTPSSWKPQPQ